MMETIKLFDDEMYIIQKWRFIKCQGGHGELVAVMRNEQLVGCSMQQKFDLSEVREIR